MTRPKVIDADGHLYENHEEIEEYFEGKYRGMRRARAYALFPSPSELHPESFRSASPKWFRKESHGRLQFTVETPVLQWRRMPESAGAYSAIKRSWESHQAYISTAM